MLPGRGNIEETAFPEIAEKGVLKYVKYRNIYFSAIDSVKDLEEADKDLRTGILSGPGASNH
ncbi:MAG: hypothetical protein QXH69_02940 [Candidatus Micrarchaeaceae archaeon]